MNANCGVACAKDGAAVEDNVAAGAGAFTKKSPVPTLPADAPAAPAGRCILRTPLVLVDEAAGVLGALVCVWTGGGGVFPTRGDAVGGSGAFAALLLWLLLLLLLLGAEPEEAAP